MPISFTSVLKKEYKDKLVELLFFNPQQYKILTKLVEIIDEYGSPTITIDGPNLRVCIENLEGLQTLYAMDGDQLVGVTVYTVFNVHTLVVLHIGIDAEYTSEGGQVNDIVVLKFVNELRRLADKLKMVKNIIILYGSGKTAKIKV